MQNFLVENLAKSYKIYREVPLKKLFQPQDIENLELREYINTSTAKLDFLICQDEKALLTIEVDGAFHRNGTDTSIPELDKLKNNCFKQMGKPTLLRVNTDGSGRWTIIGDGKITALTQEEEKTFLLGQIAAAEASSENRKFSTPAKNDSVV